MTTTSTQIPDRFDATTYALNSIRDWLKAGATIKAIDTKGDVLKIDGDTVFGGIIIKWPSNLDTHVREIPPPPPAPQWKPFTFETSDICYKVRRKSDGAFGTAGLCTDGFVFDTTIDSVLSGYTFRRALDELEQLDGTPLGVKVEEEWPRYYVHVDGSQKDLFVRYDTSESKGDAEQQVRCGNWKRITAAEAAALLAKGKQV